MINRIWNIRFGNFTSLNITAPNISAAIKLARKRRKGAYYNRIQDIDKVELVAESND